MATPDDFIITEFIEPPPERLAKLVNMNNAKQSDLFYGELKLLALAAALRASVE